MSDKPTEAAKAEFLRGLEERNARREALKRELGLHPSKNLPPQQCLGPCTLLRWTPYGYERGPEMPGPIDDTPLPPWPGDALLPLSVWASWLELCAVIDALEAVQKSEAARELGVKSGKARREASPEAKIVKKAKALLLAGEARREVAGIIAGTLTPKVTSRHVREVLKKHGI